MPYPPLFMDRVMDRERLQNCFYVTPKEVPSQENMTALQWQMILRKI